MGSLSLDAMRAYLSRSIANQNQSKNKLNGLLAEVSLRTHLTDLGYGNRVSPGGWILRREGAGTFGHNTVVVFPEEVHPDADLPAGRIPANPPLGLHTICATFHQSGIHAYYCAPSVAVTDDALSVTWQSMRLGLPAAQPWEAYPQSLAAEQFTPRLRRYAFLKYNTDTALILDDAVPEEFTKEHLRITSHSAFLCEVSDVDGIFWGQQFTYPLEIKEKTVANDRRMGDFFGLDVGPFVKLAFYAAKRGNLHSLFMVREIDNANDRNLVDWWFITFDTLAQFASWVPQSGGRSMTGGASSVVKIPKSEFLPLNAVNLATL